MLRMKIKLWLKSFLFYFLGGDTRGVFDHLASFYVKWKEDFTTKC